MKAVLYKKYGSPDVLELGEMEKPAPKENEVLVKITATTVTMVDSIFRRGDHFFARMATGPMKPKQPVLGTEFCGEVEAVGKGVTKFKPGDVVFGDSTNASGTHAEYICLPKDGAFIHKPDNISAQEAAGVAYGALTALPFMRDNGKVKNGDKVLINGASGAVGSFAVQFAKHFGAQVSAVCSTANVEMVKALGADVVIDYKKEDFTKSSETYDVVFDAVGKTSFPRSKKILKPGGIFLTTVVGFPILLQMLRTSIIGKKKAAIAFTGLRALPDKAKDLQLISELIGQGKLKAHIDKQFPLEQIADAHRYVDAGHKRGNVVVNIA